MSFGFGLSLCLCALFYFAIKRSPILFRFAITDTAYRSLRDEYLDQCILISGKQNAANKNFSAILSVT